jgi:PAS domain S-box-containing protein
MSAEMSQPVQISVPAAAPVTARAPEERLRASFAELEALYEKAPVGLCLVDRELRFVRINPLMARLHGRSVEQHLGRTMAEVLPEAARSQALGIARRVLESGEPVLNLEMQTRSPRDPEKQHWWLVSCHPVRAGSEITGLVTILQNVTALRRSEAEARRRAAELETLSEAAPVGIALVDRELRFVRVNRRLAEIDGMPAEAHAGRRVSDVVPEIPERVLAAARRCIETAEPVHGVEYSIPSRSQPGRERSYLASASPIHTDGEVVGSVCVIEDVTALKRAERLAFERLGEVETLRDRLADAQRRAGVGSWEWDILTDTVWWCDSLHAIFEKDPRTFVPSYDSFFELVHPEDRPVVRRQLEATLQRGDPYWVRFRAMLDDGSVRHIRATAILDRTPDGLPARLAGTCQLVLDLEQGSAPDGQTERRT